jgi:APA family basic amino acid/polyamine antiporter
MPALEPRLSTFDTAMVVVSLVIGIGIFRTPAMVAAAAQTPAMFFGAWLLGGLVGLAGALTMAEIGSRLPVAGAYYKVVAECYHPALAFMLNWSYVLMQGAGAAGVAFVGAEYLGALVLPSDLRSPRSILALAVALLLVLLAANALGVRAGARTQGALSLLKLAMIAVLAGAAFFRGPWRRCGRPGRAQLGSRLDRRSLAVFYAAAGAGRPQLSADSAAARRDGAGCSPSRLLPAINAGYYRAGIPGVERARRVAADLARACFGPWGEGVVSIAIFLSAAGFVNATILQLPRSYLAMAQDGLLPAAFARVHRETQVQGVGLAFVAATMLIPAFFLVVRDAAQLRDVRDPDAGHRHLHPVRSGRAALAARIRRFGCRFYPGCRPVPAVGGHLCVAVAVTRPLSPGRNRRLLAGLRRSRCSGARRFRRLARSRSPAQRLAATAVEDERRPRRSQ